jgi:phage baseplate assembly protein W
MAFNQQQINPLDIDPNVAIGINIPFSALAVFTSNYTTKDAIRNNLLNYFLTNNGERFMNPLFGGGLRGFLFEQITNNNLEFLEGTISNDIADSFPNVIVDTLNILKNEDKNTIIIEFKYSIRNTNIQDSIEISFQ